MSEEIIDKMKSKLTDINKTIAALDPSVRLAAFNILAPYYFDDYKPQTEEKEFKVKPRHSPATDDIEKFFAAYDCKDPGENVLLIVAWIYSQNGLIPITAAMCSDVSVNTGITIPVRPDNTMRTVKRNGKNLFHQVKNGWQLTTQGELFVKDTYGVRRGNKKAESTK